MARAVSEKLSCDVCGTTSRVESFTIVTAEGAAIVDLCPGDARPLLNLWRQGSTQPRKKVTGNRSRSSGHAVIPVD